MPLRLLTAEGKQEDGAAIRKWVAAHMPVGSAHHKDCPGFWLDIVEPDDAAISWLAEHFHFHPLTIEDLRSPNERGKIELYESYLFLIAHSVEVEGVRIDPHKRVGQGHDGRHTGHQHPQPNPPAAVTGKLPSDNPVCEIRSHEVHAYLSQNYLITVHDDQMVPVEKVWSHIDDRSPEGDAHPLAHGPDYLLYQVL
ncbi:MAG TPA: CorA family divalent cation transporter, partial [Chloroflexia bacterium]|nr:CorA family divalent cation transporter [Chloroflexia bacterium]